MNLFFNFLLSPVIELKPHTIALFLWHHITKVQQMRLQEM